MARRNIKHSKYLVFTFHFEGIVSAILKGTYVQCNPRKIKNLHFDLKIRSVPVVIVTKIVFKLPISAWHLNSDWRQSIDDSSIQKRQTNVGWSRLLEHHGKVAVERILQSIQRLNV